MTVLSDILSEVEVLLDFDSAILLELLSEVEVDSEDRLA